MSDTKNRPWRAAVDTGGTFTDGCMLNESTGELHVVKVLSTPEDPSRAIMRALHRLTEKSGMDLSGLYLLLHGTTVATNALLQCRVSKTALVITRGFKDVLHIGRQNRPHLYDFRINRPSPLIPRHMTVEADERMLPGGRVLKPLNESGVEDVIKQLKAINPVSVAVSFLHSYANPAHEIIIKEALQRELPGVPVTLSSELLPEIREYERTSTTAINAVVMPEMSYYLKELQSKLSNLETSGKKGLFVMQSNGGVLSAGQAAAESARTVLSGPAGGVLWGVLLGRETGRPSIITADMGGTSTDVSLIFRGSPRQTTEGCVGGFPLRLPMLDIHTIGAGGGSIAFVDRGGALRVGPQSAGAAPGPACYGLGGTEPTVTDANLVLGRLNPAVKMGENNHLDMDAARRAILGKIAIPLGLSLEKAAEGIITVVNAEMTRAIRLISVQRGYDPRDFALLAFGGAGPLHAAELAGEIGLSSVLIPRYPGVSSAAGILFADGRRDYSSAVITPWNEIDTDALTKRFISLENRAKSDFSTEGFDTDKVVITRSFDVKYCGQSYELNLPAPAGKLTPGDMKLLARSFHLTHRAEYGFAREDAPIELTAIRAAAVVSLSRPADSSRPGGVFKRKETFAPKSGSVPQRKVIFNGISHSTAVYLRQNLYPEDQIQGPAVVEQEDSTTLIPPGMRARVDILQNLVIDMGVAQWTR
ncbi:N-methylhydantoinase A [Desulfocucumis palustris]|uniref:N-methylhydantoinase A n=1 Tax=Desulfocucumis palustris TaxID=1898651 RepID=A0A2L2XM44_9FIRM|nr:hydantoinase/oxoprolinase family protein [Desulfocucumis palustris]GBF35021.1 N-methylhydantoinase A [Desulfocucumis palustris]